MFYDDIGLLISVAVKVTVIYCEILLVNQYKFKKLATLNINMPATSRL